MVYNKMSIFDSFHPKHDQDIETAPRVHESSRINRSQDHSRWSSYFKMLLGTWWDIWDLNIVNILSAYPNLDFRNLLCYHHFTYNEEYVIRDESINYLDIYDKVVMQKCYMMHIDAHETLSSTITCVYISILIFESRIFS